MKIIVAAIALLSVGLSANHTINNPVPEPISDYCGAGNRGCAAALEKDYMHIGYERLPNTSSRPSRILPALAPGIRTGTMIVFLHRKRCLRASASRRTTNPPPALSKGFCLPAEPFFVIGG